MRIAVPYEGFKGCSSLKEVDMETWCSILPSKSTG